MMNCREGVKLALKSSTYRETLIFTMRHIKSAAQAAVMSAENCERVGFKFKFLVWKTFDPAWQRVDLWEIMNTHLHNGAVKTEIFSC